MREIKFRAWDNCEMEMIKNPDLLILENGECYPWNKKGERSEYIFLMQFTGLKDKNGKEIYEGDIVKFDNADEVKVMWSSKEALFLGIIIKTMDEEYPTYMRFLGYDLYKNPEVIGNIYENPELLEESKSVKE